MTGEAESFGGPLSGLGDGDEKNCPISEPASAAAYCGVAMAPVARFSYPILPHRSERDQGQTLSPATFQD